MHLEGLTDFDPTLRQELAAVHDGDFMDTAVVFGDGEAKCQPAIWIDLCLAQRFGGFGIFLPLEPEGVFDNPSTVDRSPLNVHFFPWRQTFGCRGHCRAGYRLRGFV